METMLCNGMLLNTSLTLSLLNSNTEHTENPRGGAPEDDEHAPLALVPQDLNFQVMG
jgi:hypothetical protein